MVYFSIETGETETANDWRWALYSRPLDCGKSEDKQNCGPRNARCSLQST